MEAASGFSSYDYETNTGWNGSYITNEKKLNSDDISGNFSSSTYLHNGLAAGNYAPLDGWVHLLFCKNILQMVLVLL